MGGLQEETSRRLPGSQDFRAWIFLLASHVVHVAWHDFRANTCLLGKSWDRSLGSSNLEVLITKYFQNWHANEPNDAHGSEDCAHISIQFSLNWERLKEYR